jgi:GGDEF domain-containing protein
MGDRQQQPARSRRVLQDDQNRSFGPTGPHSAEEGVYFARLLHKRLSSVLAGTPHPVTCSMGALLISPDTPRDEPSLMHAVDQLMYAVKRAGKNAVEIGRGTTGRGRDTPVPSRLRVMEAT